jgi:histidyl-tRNA synthetase
LQVPFCVVIGSEEAANRQCGLKDLTSGEQVDVSLDELPQTIQQKLQLSS